MNISSITTDNITELLVKIVDFTKRRSQVLTANILDVETRGFVPKDLDVDGFAELMAQAVFEHIHNSRLLFYDTQNIKFGEDGSFETLPVVDEQGRLLLERDKETFLQLQIDKLTENLANNRIATEFLVLHQNKKQIAQHPY
jgi:flagellar basal body rod protein FlgB